MLYTDIKKGFVEDLLGLTKEYTIDGLTFNIRQYLTSQEKGEIVSYVVNMALDGNTGCFSPLRINIYYTIAMLQKYCGIEFDIPASELAEAYDMLDCSGMVDALLAQIPQEERKYMEELTDETITDIERYNNSFAGIVQAMSGDAANLDTSIQDILEKIKNKEGLEVLSEIKNVVGTD